MAELIAAVDVGTGSARAGVFDRDGAMLGRAEAPIEIRDAGGGGFEQDSGEIWRAVGGALRAARAEAAASPDAVAGLAFDATCSLVLRDRADRPLAAGPGDARWDTLLWLDHRAQAEAAIITASGHPALDREGGAMSPEMQLPKLLWLKRRRPETWARLGRAFDLSDFLAWSATGNPARSICALACKWTYRADSPEPWALGLFEAVGLSDVIDRAGLPARAAPVGTDLGPLTDVAAVALGLTTACRVAAGLIDAHAGALGCLGPAAGGAVPRYALIGGTSTCVMEIGPEAPPARGLWGPHRDAILPGLWVREGGQSVSGGLLDHLCRLWLGGAVPDGALHARIARRIAELRASAGWDFAGDLHVLPDFAGSRTPFAAPQLRGVISGMGLDGGFDGLCRLYWRTAVALALGLRQILALMTGEVSARPDLHLAGGHTRSPLLIELYASATGCRVRAPREADAVLLGTAMAAAVGAGLWPSLAAASAAMSRPMETRAPDASGADRLARDYAVLQAMQRHRAEIAALAAGGPAPAA